MRLLIAEDERDLNRILTKRLSEEGYSIDACFNGEDALYYLKSIEYDAAILDVMMPKMDGFAVLKAIRDKGIGIPVLLLTARDAIADRVHGLDLGANDYLVKPFSMDELLARVRVLIRRISNAKSSVLSCGDLVLNLSSHTVARAGNNIELSGKEYALLSYMMLNQNIILSREKIEDHVWNYDYEGGTNVVDVYIRYLRKKIDDDYENKLIKTVRGMGYMLTNE